MRAVAFVILFSAFASLAAAQVPAPPGALNPSSALSGDLDKLQSAASQANLDIAHMRIEKWKADGASKQQAQANADSLQRNLTTALPGLLANFRAAPQDLNAGFKLYRNLNALYDVLVSFTESAGAFGPRNEYEELAQQLNVIDAVRHDLGDHLENLTASTQSEITELRTRIQTMQQAAAAAAAAPPPKKVVVDDNEPAKKPVHKKKSTTTTGAGSSASQAGSSTQPTTPSPSAKSQ
jgi:hypothetical protein